MSKIYLAGHSHIDSEWVWTIDETKYVCYKTFRDTISVLEKYPEVTYIQSSSIYYKWMKEEHPEIYAKIKELVKKGQWKIVGGTFLEFDPNMPHGESLIRHFLYGKRFFIREFNKDVDVLWLADSFGYPASLPKIMKHCGVKYFSTHKLKWNDTTEFPYYLFWWEGDNKDRVLAYNLPGTYDEYLWSPQVLLRLSRMMLGRHGIPETLVIFGRGDHGGGPEEIEVLNVRKWKKTMDIEYSGISEYLKIIGKNYKNKLPLWKGELYLELHRGVFTTLGEFKRKNIKAEWLLLDTEKLAVSAYYAGKKYPREELRELWEKLMLGHSHDILCGTVSEEVAIEGFKRINDIIKSTEKLQKRILDSLSSGSGTTLVNLNSWEYSGVIETDIDSLKNSQKSANGKYLVLIKKLDGHSSLSIEKCVASPSHPVSAATKNGNYIISNGIIEAVINGNGHVVSLKLKGEEMLSAPIRIRMHSDYPVPERRSGLVEATMFDAWEIFAYDGINRYFYKDLKKPVEIKILENGPLRAKIRVKYEYSQKLRKKSTFVLDYFVEADSQVLGIDIKIEWHAWHKLAKLLVPLKHRGKNVILEAPYGINTRKDVAASDAKPYERAKYEGAGQRWVTSGDEKYGVALINSARYGYSYINGMLGLTLIRGPTYPSWKTHGPNPDVMKLTYSLQLDKRINMLPEFIKKIWGFLAFARAELNVFKPMDQGTHYIRVGIYPYKGSWNNARIYQVAYSFLRPPLIVKKKVSLTLPRIKGEAVITAIKLHEDGNSTVIRVFNPLQKEITVSLELPSPAKVYEADGLERKTQEVQPEKLVLPPLAIKTLIIE